MFDARLRRLIDPTLDRIGGRLARRGISADAVTLLGLGAGLAAAVCIALGAFGWGLALILASRLCDGLDGALARAGRATDAGGFLDITADFIFYGAVPFGFALADPQANALAAAALLLSFYINGSAFLAFATLVEKAPVLGAAGDKSFHHLWGIAEAAETLAVFVLMAAFPSLFPALAWGFALVCTLSGIARIATGYLAARAHASRGGKT